MPAGTISADATTIRLTSELLGKLEIPRANVRAVLLQALKPDWTLQWDAFVERTSEKDMLIVEKRDGLGLDFLSGVVSTVTEEAVPFLLDGNEIPVPRQRVVGVVFGNIDESAARLSSGLSMKLIDGTVLRGRQLTMDNLTFRVEAGWGGSLQIPVSNVQSIDFSSGRLHYLSDLEPINEQYLGLDPA